MAKGAPQSKHSVRKAVFPAAGLGTRFLPATKAQPKEMLPIVDKPLIQYGVEEAIRSGISNIIIVTGRGKSSIEDHFDVSFELEHMLENKRPNRELLSLVRSVAADADISYCRQKEALGLGHAVRRARELVGNEPFAVVLSDDLIHSRTPCLDQLIRAFDHTGGAPVLALMEVPRTDTHLYGVVKAEPVENYDGRLFRITDLVEKPAPAKAPSNLAIVGRYVLIPEIFDSIDRTGPGAGGEIQLTDGLKHLLRTHTLYGYLFEGERYDAGDKMGYLRATVEFALRRPDLGRPFRDYLKSIKL
ncbi:MAG: UTP--glucose-1-phosphate uridylyltransferase GalU [Acidobacteria bacterium]|nr:UTP--glucose-1-phosphate uridylyltransferase GalU [Acidobacteriota bacterium]